MRALTYWQTGEEIRPGKVTDSSFSEYNWGPARSPAGEWALSLIDTLQDLDDSRWTRIFLTAEAFRVKHFTKRAARVPPTPSTSTAATAPPLRRSRKLSVSDEEDNDDA